MTRIKIPQDTEFQLREGMILSLGLHQLFYVYKIEVDLSAKQIEDDETITMNRINTEGVIPSKLTLKGITGDHEGSEYILDANTQNIGYQDRGIRGFSMARGNESNPRDILFTSAEVSGYHGIIKFVGQNWVYIDLGSTHGSWVNVSTHDELYNFENSQL